MPRPATGRVIEKPTAARGMSYALRFTALGQRQYVHLGYEADGLTRAKADDELIVVMAQVRRGAWRPPEPAPIVEVEAEPSFLEFASERHEARRRELAPNTVASRESMLSNHLLPFFANHLPSQITVREVDRYREAKVREAEQRAAAIALALARREAAVAVAVEAGTSRCARRSRRPR